MIYTVRLATDSDAQIIADLFNYHIERTVIKIPTRWTDKDVLNNIRAPDQYMVIARETLTGKDEAFWGTFHDGPGLPLRIITAGYRELSHTGLQHPRHYLMLKLAEMGAAKGKDGWTVLKVAGPQNCVLAPLVQPVVTANKPPENITYPVFDGEAGICVETNMAEFLKWAKGKL